MQTRVMMPDSIAHNSRSKMLKLKLLESPSTVAVAMGQVGRGSWSR